MLKELQVSTVQEDCGSSFEVRLRAREKAGRKDGKDWKQRCLG